MIEISVIIPVYNCEDYLKECLDSVVNQTINKDLVEVIIVDDYSIDNSPIICKEYVDKNKNWKFFRNKKNQGPAITRNFAIKQASGRYIAFLDSDDILYKDNLKTLYDNAIETDADIVIARLNAFDKNGEYGYYSDKYINDNKVTNIFKDKQLINCISICSKLFKKDLITKNNIIFLENTLHEDNSFSILALLNAEKISVLKKYLYYRRYRDIKKDSIMQNLDYKTYEDLIKNYRYIITNFHKKRNLSFVHLYMIRKASNNIIMHVKKSQWQKGKIEFKKFINFLYYNGYISKIRKRFYLVFFIIYFNFASFYKGVIR